MSQKIEISKETLIKLIKEGKNNRNIAEIYNTSPKTISKRFKEHNIRPHDYKLNHNHFSNIDSEDKAYWLGYIFADGCIFLQDNCHRIEISSKDIEHLNKWIVSVEAVNKVHISKGYGKVVLASKQMFGDLQNLGCVQRKSLILKFPDINIKLVRHFIRGYFDGDGSVFWEKKKNKVPQLGIAFVGTKHVLENINKYSPSFLNIRKHSCGSVYVSEFRGNNKARAFRDWLYKDATIYLDRKREKFLELK